MRPKQSQKDIESLICTHMAIAFANNQDATLHAFLLSDASGFSFIIISLIDPGYHHMPVPQSRQPFVHWPCWRQHHLLLFLDTLALHMDCLFHASYSVIGSQLSQISPIQSAQSTCQRLVGA